MHQASTTPCPKCGAPNLRGTWVCTHCGSTLIIYCPQCHASNEAGSQYCHNCHAPLITSTLPNTRPHRDIHRHPVSSSHTRSMISNPIPATASNLPILATTSNLPIVATTSNNPLILAMTPTSNTREAMIPTALTLHPHLTGPGRPR